MTFRRRLSRGFPRAASIYRSVLLLLHGFLLLPYWRRKFKKVIEAIESPCLELGSRPQSGTPPWITVDTSRGADLRWDLGRGIPVADACVHKIYTSHFLEHLDYMDVAKVLRECHRVLRAGGEISVCVPTIEPWIRAYLSETEAKPRSECANPHYADSGTFLDQVNYIAYYGGEHKLMFDDALLQAVLRKAGFREVVSREFDASIDLPERRDGSIYAVGRK